MEKKTKRQKNKKEGGTRRVRPGIEMRGEAKQNNNNNNNNNKNSPYCCSNLVHCGDGDGGGGGGEPRSRAVALGGEFAAASWRALKVRCGRRVVKSAHEKSVLSVVLGI